MTVGWGWGNGGRDEIPDETPCSPLWLWESEVVPWRNRGVPRSREKENLETWSQLQEELNSHSSGSSSDHLRGETGTEIMICQ